MPEVVDAFQRSVDEGEHRLERSWPALVATGFVGGLDVSTGVFAMLLVIEKTHGNKLLGALAFGIGFLALTLASSELFTENFLIPINAVVARKAPWWSPLRLWSGTLVFNLLGGWIAMWLVLTGFPELKAVAVDVGHHPATLGINLQSFASAVLGGALITLMTWMERSTESIFGKVVAAWSIAFILAGAPLHHAIVISIEMFAAFHAGADFGYADWLGALAWAALGNLIGGVGFVTVLRLVQVGSEEIKKEQDRPKDEPREEDGPSESAETA
jgi:formate/nitrite transporter FocA (FNT family)